MKKIEKLIENVEIKCGNISDLNKISEHPSYIKIIAYGKKSIPFLLEKLNDQTCMFWVDALRKISGENPDENYIKTIDIKSSWIKWSIENNIKI